MAKHQLIISRDINRKHPVRSEAGQSKVISRVVVNWKGTWEPDAQPEMYLLVAPQDEIEIVLQPDEYGSASLWFMKPMEQGAPLFQPPGNPFKRLASLFRKDDEERVDLKRGSKVLQVNDALAGEPGELRYVLRISGLGERPVPIGGQGNPGTLTASKP
ncbi:hypothetical protein ACN28I_34140 [Archangium gephyra]|uniref:hypothetical protein n=1 Tax=Archangium gephyra TaxID=48 RepID=UPI003B80ECD4